MAAARRGLGAHAGPWRRRIRHSGPLPLPPWIRGRRREAEVRRRRGMEAAAGCGAAGGDEGAARSHGCCEGENEKRGKRKMRTELRRVESTDGKIRIGLSSPDGANLKTAHSTPP